MAYLIYNNDGTILTSIANGEVDSVSTDLTLIGKNVDNYGQYLNNNFIKLLTSFASTTSPTSPQIGQVWFNSTTGRLNVYDGIAFNPTYGARVNGTPSITTSTGDLWYDTNNSQLKIWNGSTYKLVGPSVSALKGKFNIEPSSSTIIPDDSGYPVDVGVIYSYGNPSGLITNESFNMKASDAVGYFGSSAITTIVTGTTFVRDIDVKGDLYIKGIKQSTTPTVETVTASFDITSYGDPQDATTTTAIANIASGNIAIRNFLPLMFSTVTNITYGDIAYSIGTIAKVVCSYNTDVSVRRFKLIDDPIHPGIHIWNWDNVYLTTFSPSGYITSTNIVQL